MSSRWIPRSTPFPNVLIDQVMPRLRDTEWRVLVIIVRATLGWIDPLTGMRKQRERLSSQQLRRRAGRESAAVSAALDVLHAARIILIRDQEGNSVDSASARRRARRRFFYSLHPDLLRTL